MISVLIAFRNQAEYLPQAMRSVEGQDFKDYEVLLIDDASTDGSSETARRQALSNGWRYLRLRRAGGPAVARAEGERRARGGWIAFLDGDDLWRPDKLKVQWEWARRPGVVMTFSDFGLIDSRGMRHRRDASPKSLTFGMRPSYPFYPNACMTSMVMLDRAALREAGGIDTSYRYLYDDYDLWHRMSRRFGPRGWRFVPRRLGSYRVQPGGISNLLDADTLDERAVQARLDLACFKRRWH